MGTRNRIKRRRNRRIMSVLKHRRQLTGILSVAVVFLVVSALIVPASTLTKKEAKKQGGIDVSTVQSSSEEAGAAEAAQTGGDKESSDGNTESTVSEKDAGGKGAKAFGSDKQDEKEKDDKAAPQSDPKKDAADKDDEKKDSRDEDDTGKDETYAAGKLTYEGTGFDVEAAYKKAAKIPEDAKISVKEIKEKSNPTEYKKYYDKALEAVQANAGKDKVSDLSFARFYDITLTADGDEIEPEDTVKVTVSYDQALKAKKADHVKVVHFSEDKNTGELKAEVLDKEHVAPEIRDEEMKKFAFDAESFSVYAVTYLMPDEDEADNETSSDDKSSDEAADDAAEEDGNEEDEELPVQELKTEGDDYTITVSYNEDAGIPEGSTLEADEIAKDSKQYKDYLKQSKKALTVEDEEKPDITFARFFDVTILDPSGKKIEPDDTVSVEIKYDDVVKVNGDRTLIVHFADDGIEVLGAKTKLEGQGKVGTANVFEYEQDSFSGVGTIVETDSLEDGQYFIVVGDNGNYYAMKNDGTPVKVTYYAQTKQVEAESGTDENDLLWNVSSAGYGYYTFKAVNGNNYLSLENGAVVVNQSKNILVQHNSWDETQNETGGYNLYHTPNPWDSSTWNPLCLGYWNNSSHFYVGDSGSEPQRIKLYKYAMSTSTGEPPATNTYSGIEVNPSELDEWLMSLFDDMPIGYDGYDKTAEVYDYENRIYQIDFTALSNAQGFASDMDIAFSVDMSNSMLFPSTLTEIGSIELRQSVLESALDKDQVYFVISDVKATATVNAVFYETLCHLL